MAVAGGQISISIAEKVILESKKRGISGIICAIGRLTIGKKVKSLEMSKELTVDYTFNQFRQKGESCNWSLVGKILRVKSRLLDFFILIDFYKTLVSTSTAIRTNYLLCVSGLTMAFFSARTSQCSTMS